MRAVNDNHPAAAPLRDRASRPLTPARLQEAYASVVAPGDFPAQVMLLTRGRGPKTPARPARATEGASPARTPSASLTPTRLRA